MKEVFLKRGKYRPRQRPLSEAEIAEIWTRRAAGEAGTRIARHIGRYWRSVGDYLNQVGGIRPRQRTKSRIALSLQEREEISRGLAAAESLRSIALKIGRSPSTVSREVRRNRGRQNYRASAAEQAALGRSKRPKAAKLMICSKLRAEVVARLELDWSPQQISRFLKEEHPEEPLMQVSHETIYISLYVQGRGLLRKELTKHLRRRHMIRQPRRRDLTNRGKIKDMILISERPAEAADRAVPGHWEGDLLLGTPTTAIGTLVERSTRFVMLFKLPSGINAESARLGLTEKILTLPENLRRSLTWDQGREMKQHARFTIDTGVQIYFCDPKSPWQRGTNENTNGPAAPVLSSIQDCWSLHPGTSGQGCRPTQWTSPRDPWLDVAGKEAGPVPGRIIGSRCCAHRMRPPAKRAEYTMRSSRGSARGLAEGELPIIHVLP